MVHLVVLIAGLSVGLLHHLRLLRHLAAADRAGLRRAGARHQHRGDGAAAGGHAPIAGSASDRFGRRPVLRGRPAALALFAYPLMALMARGQPGRSSRGQAGLALLHRDRRRRAPRGDGRADALAGPLHGALGGVQRGDGAARRHHADGRHLAARPDRAVSRRRFTSPPRRARLVGALLLPRAARHGLTREFAAVRLR